MPDDDRQNPYDFRSPIRSRTHLAGRDSELETIDGLLRQATNGQPTHLSIFGEEGTGKSSLLNVVADIARSRGMLAVEIELTPANVDTEVDFYKTLIDATLQALIDHGTLTSSDEVMRRWMFRTYAGASIQNPDDMADSELELGLLVAAKLNGRMVEHVPVQVIVRDLTRLLARLGVEPPRLVLCLDRAEAIDRNKDLAPSITQVVDAMPDLTIVTAAQTAGDLQNAAPRGWSQIEVGAYPGVGGVLDAMTKPIRDRKLSTSTPTPDTARDILEFTGGIPYEVTLVCHFIWDAIQQGEQDDFDFSPNVLQRVVAELDEKGRHQASPEIARYSSLTRPDYEQLLTIAPYESLSVREIALLRIPFEGYDADALSVAEAGVHQDLQRLERKGLVTVEGDRFSLAASRDGRLYLKYATKHFTGSDLHYGKTYQAELGERCLESIGQAIWANDYPENLVLRGRRPQEVGDASAGDWLAAIKESANNCDVGAVAEAFGRILGSLADTADPTPESFSISSLHLQVGLYDVEEIDLVANPSPPDPSGLNEKCERWTADHQHLFDTYDVRVVDCECITVPSHLILSAAAYHQLLLACAVSYPMYSGGAHRAAARLLDSVLKNVTRLVGDDPKDPLLRTELANALGRDGFMAASVGDWPKALDRFHRSRTMALTEEWILDYNEAYVKARQGNFQAACDLTSAAITHWSDTVEQVLLNAYFPAPSEWNSDSEWSLVELSGKWIKRFLELQRTVLRSVNAPEDNKKDLRVAVEALDGSPPVAMLRLAGWATLTILGDPGLAVATFERAAAQSRYDETVIPDQEAAFAREQANSN
jgi:hypothetical protein